MGKTEVTVLQVDVQEMEKQARALVTGVGSATASSPNEASLRHEIENCLEAACAALSIPWTPFQLDRTLKRADGNVRFADASHGAVIIEYEPPHSFRGRSGAELRHAKQQAEEYAILLSAEEGRPIREYTLVAWDGSHIGFGAYTTEGFQWGAIALFDDTQAKRLLTHLHENGMPLVHPQLLSALVGPDSMLGSALLPHFFQAILDAASMPETTKAKLLFTEWKRLFGQVIGVQSDALKNLLREQGLRHKAHYEQDTAAYLFALNSYIALIAKFVAALALPSVSEDISNVTVPIYQRIWALESGQLFAGAGISNMLNGDFFSWYAEHEYWDRFASPIAHIIDRLSAVSFDITRKSPDSTRDLFKGLYMSFVPRAVRHALGEFYTPDWLAAYALDLVGWDPARGLIDPTVGSGTFVLEGLKRRLMTANSKTTAGELLDGLAGMDLNPLAVLAARAALVVFLAKRLDPARPVRLPIYLADAINPAELIGECYEHSLQTELGVKRFSIPQKLVHHHAYFDVMARMRDLIEAEQPIEAVVRAVSKVVPALSDDDLRAISDTTATLKELHDHGWNGIWCAILADRFAAGALNPSEYVVGNPPWVKWSHLPPDYAAFIKQRCLELGVFSTDRWVGGIESDISTVITYVAVEKYVQHRGALAFFITGSVFSNESSQGFRRWRINDRDIDMQVVRVEDFAAIAPFEGVTNHPALLVLVKGDTTEYPVPYRKWLGPRKPFESASQFSEEARYDDLFAAPVPGSDAGPWLKGTLAQHAVWTHLFRNGERSYRARKGVTTDCNGAFFVKATPTTQPDKCVITNDPSLGRKQELPLVREVIETRYLYPLLRGRGLKAFSVQPDPAYRVIVPQSGMHGDPELPVNAPNTYRYLSRFEGILRNRSSYRRFQPSRPFWSLWSTGEYTFAPFKVLWKEMGEAFSAAYIGAVHDPVLGDKVAVPDHKLYFVPLQTEAEAAYLTGILNAPMVAEAISAYAAQLSLGASVVEYLHVPKFDEQNSHHVQLSQQVQTMTHAGRYLAADLDKVEHIVKHILNLPL